MKCFDVVNTVLDATYAQVPNAAGKRDDLIRSALVEMRDRYNNHLMEEGGPDFDDPVTRFGYVFTYVPAHAHWIYELINQCKSAREIFAQGKARIACLGGGPGSDIVGVLKYLDESKTKCRLFMELIDGCEAWKTTWGDLAFQLDWDDPLHTDYVIHDVADKKTWKSPTNIGKADLVTLSFFASEIFHLDNARKYLKHMMAQVKSGAIVLVNDNRTSEVYDMLDALAGDLGFKTLVADAGVRKIYDAGESSAVVKQYADKLGAQSRLTGKLFWRIYKKP